MGRLLLRWILLAISVIVASIITHLLGLKLDVHYDTVPIFSNSCSA